MKCVFCRSEKTQPEDFRDDCSRKEWNISHICQKCQDFTFGPPPGKSPKIDEKKEEKKHE